MAEGPKIVRERLSHQAAGEHLDANLISAFVEHGLTEPERAQVLDHLSRCADCRQIVALTAPELAEEQLAAVRAPAASRSWWRSPLLHWGAFTAAALVVLIAVGARMRLREGHSASAPAIATVSSSEAAQKSAAEAPQAPAPAAEPKQPTRMAKAPTTRRAREALSRAKTAEAVSGGTIAAFGGDAGGIAAKNAPPAPPPPAAPAPKPHPSANEMEGPPVAAAKKTDQVQAPAVAFPSTAAGQTGVVVGALGTGTAAAAGVKSEAAVLSQSRSAMLAKRASLSARWSVSDSGSLQRSFDGGRSWQDIAVGAGITFRTVATVGSDVWAGGSGAALFHSADGGEHWSRVPVQAKGRAPNGDIVRIEFADTQNGTVTTSTGEIWTTSDAGTTWRLQ